MDVGADNHTKEISWMENSTASESINIWSLGTGALLERKPILVAFGKMIKHGMAKLKLGYPMELCTLALLKIALCMAGE